MRVVILVLAVTLCPIRAAPAWGDTGHRIICEIAFQELTATARQRVRQRIRLDGEFRRFSDACTLELLFEVGQRELPPEPRGTGPARLGEICGFPWTADRGIVRSDSRITPSVRAAVAPAIKPLAEATRLETDAGT
jgi:hypothetical protein